MSLPIHSPANLHGEHAELVGALARSIPLNQRSSLTGKRMALGGGGGALARCTECDLVRVAVTITAT